MHVRGLDLYRSGLKIVSDLSFDLENGDLVAVIGPNGGGKTTLLEALASKFLPKDARGVLKRRDLLHSDTAYLPQVSAAQRHFPLLVKDVVACGLWVRLGIWGSMNRSHHALIGEALAAVGLEKFADQPIQALSGGQFQRMLFARLMVQDARLLLLDEPLTGVDPPTRAYLVSLIQEWHKAGKTVMVVLHDPHVVRTTFPKTLLLAREFSAFGDTRSILTPEVLRKAYGHAQDWEGEA